jgi:UDP-N-acetylmuramoyl-L-alanyl-D-glutamate--2,6-diaminopimelate ligase
VRLTTLLHDAGLPFLPSISAPDPTIRNVRYDSRRVAPGDLFVAVPGTTTDGHDHIGAAVAAGAVTVVVERRDACPAEVPCIVVTSSRAALADLAAALHGFPARRLHVTGVTGTDGKTTSTFLLAHLLDGLGHPSGLLSTVAFKIGDAWEENLARQSTLESPEIQDALAGMHERGIRDVVLEATSHGLVQQRVRRCAFDAALITNVTSEHLDFHGTREGYLSAKALLLAALADADGKPGPRFAAINADDEGAASLVSRSPVPVLTYGLGDGCAVRGERVGCDAAGSRFDLVVDGLRLPAATRLPGLFNVYNCLGVMAVLVGRGLSLEAALPHLATFEGVPGRMRRVDEGQPFAVVVDYAHTAASLEKVLATLRPLTAGRLIAVFGSAGDRDREKRPVMGRVAARCADFSIFADEDPRGEPSMAIIDEIAAGAIAAGAREGQQFERIPERRAAIERAVSLAREGDVVLLAGKGHERSILVAGGSVPWDEEGAARAALRGRGYGR